VQRASRVCVTLLDRAGASATELVENAGPISEGEQDAFRVAYQQEATRAEAIVLIGSLPTGTPAEFYRALLSSQSSNKTTLDARGEELLAALCARPTLVKLNRVELEETLRRSLVVAENLLEAMAELIERGAAAVLVTDGPRPLYLRSLQGTFKLQPPLLEVVNPIGCGDAMAGAIALALTQGEEPPAAVRFGVAVAADKATRRLPGRVDPQCVRALMPRIAIREV